MSGYLTRPGNYLGLCGLSMPSGLSRGLPVGIQILGKPYAERDVLKFGKAFQDATDFHRRAPRLLSSAPVIPSEARDLWYAAKVPRFARDDRLRLHQYLPSHRCGMPCGTTVCTIEASSAS